METGAAAGEMRLSFKGSASDTLKLPITQPVHASVSLIRQEREGERGGGEWGERGHEGKKVFLITLSCPQGCNRVSCRGFGQMVLHYDISYNNPILVEPISQN